MIDPALPQPMDESPMLSPEIAVSRLAALAQEHRLAAFRLLIAAGPAGMPAGALAAQLGLAPSSASFHLASLLHAGLVHQRRAGRTILYAADNAAIGALIGYLTENCCGGAGCAGVPAPSPAPSPAI